MFLFYFIFFLGICQMDITLCLKFFKALKLFYTILILFTNFLEVDMGQWLPTILEVDMDQWLPTIDKFIFVKMEI